MLHYNSMNNCTVLFALMEGGVISSFEIEHNYTPKVQEPGQYGDHWSRGRMNINQDGYFEDDTVYYSNQEQRTYTSRSGSRRNRKKGFLTQILGWIFNKISLQSIKDELRNSSNYTIPSDASFLQKIAIIFFEYVNKAIIIITDIVTLICLALCFKIIITKLNDLFNNVGFDFG